MQILFRDVVIHHALFVKQVVHRLHNIENN